MSKMTTKTTNAASTGHLAGEVDPTEGIIAEHCYKGYMGITFPCVDCVNKYDCYSRNALEVKEVKV